jgi:hypothetical protein
MLPGDVTAKPLWVVCEDGSEYLERFRRFLDGEFQFVAAASGAALLAALDAADATGVILDLDFRRTAAAELVDEQGETNDALAEPSRRRLAETQGILILRLLRARGHRAPVLLFADFDDAGQVAYLESTLAPLAVVPSHEGLVAIAARMRAAGSGAGSVTPPSGTGG